MALRQTLEEFTFSNGVKVPPGVVISISYNTHHDPEIFEDPLKFDGFRFVKMRERAVMEGHDSPGQEIRRRIYLSSFTRLLSRPSCMPWSVFGSC